MARADTAVARRLQPARTHRLTVRSVVLLLGAGALVLLPSLVAAQTQSNAPVIGRLELTTGAGFVGGADLGSADANLRANSLTPQPYRLFTTDARFGSAPVVEGRAGVALTRRYAIEGVFAFGRPALRASVSSDAEGAPDMTVEERVDQYLVGAALVMMLEEWRVGPFVPFVTAGAGFVRQLHEGATLIESGRFYQVGGGVKHWFFASRRGTPRATGVRADVRLYILDGGISYDNSARAHAAMSGSFFVVF